MTNSHEVINLQTMAQCLADARTLLREGDMCADTYVSLLEEASRLIRSVLAFAQDVGLEIDDGEETEAYKIVDHCKVVQDHRRSPCFQGGDYDLYCDCQSPGGVLTLECGPGTDESLNWPLIRYQFYDLNKAVDEWVRVSQSEGTA